MNLLVFQYDISKPHVDFSSFFTMVLWGSTPLHEKLGLKDVVKRDYGRLDSYVDLLLLGMTSKIVPAASYFRISL